MNKYGLILMMLLLGTHAVAKLRIETDTSFTPDGSKDEPYTCSPKGAPPPNQSSYKVNVSGMIEHVLTAWTFINDTIPRAMRTTAKSALAAGMILLTKKCEKLSSPDGKRKARLKWQSTFVGMLYSFSFKPRKNLTKYGISVRNTYIGGWYSGGSDLAVRFSSVGVCEC